ncbi:MAG: nitroreductase family protein, partial [Candidatus Lokiarchaeota archaeon]|nr:nitroreductase family protein [Candidatus Lokiarchaeota archaeon]
MPILGIDYEKCNDCKICLRVCPRLFSRDKEQDKIVFEDPHNTCNLDGRCIAMCPSGAILYEDLGDVLSFKETQDPSTLIPYETMHKFMSSKRSIRGFKKKKVPRATMEQVLSTMKYAPTGANIRTLECSIISDNAIIKKLSESVMDAIIASNNPSYSENLKKAKEFGFDAIFYNAPHVMIIHSPNPMDGMNATIALTYGMLSAQSLGLGTCWIGLAYGVLITSKEIREKIAG